MKIYRFMIPLLLLITILASSCSLSASSTPATATLQPGLNNNTLLETIDALSTESGAGQSADLSTVTPAGTEPAVSTAAEIFTGTEIIEPTQTESPNSTPAPTLVGGVPIVPITPIATLSYSSAGFAVTHIAMSVDTNTSSVNCPPGHSFNFSADIQTNSGGTITYYWDFSDGSKSSEKMLNYSSASTQMVYTSWNPGAAGPASTNPFKGWARIYVDAPNHQFFSNEAILLTCNSSSSPSDTPVPTP